MISNFFLALVLLVSVGSQFRAARLVRRRSKSDQLLGLGIILFCLSLEVTCLSVFVLKRSIDSWSPALRSSIWAGSLLGIGLVLLGFVFGRGRDGS